MGGVTSILFIVSHGILQHELHQLPRQVHITENKMSTGSPFSDSMGDEVLQTDSSVTRLHGPRHSLRMTTCQHSVDGIAIRCGMDGLGSNPGGCERFSPPLQSRLAQMHTQHLVQWEPGIVWLKGLEHIFDHSLLCSAKVNSE